MQNSRLFIIIVILFCTLLVLMCDFDINTIQNDKQKLTRQMKLFFEFRIAFY